MRKILLAVFMGAFFISCSNLDDGIEVLDNTHNQTELTSNGYLDPTQLWGEDSTGGSGGSGTTVNSIQGNCDLGNFTYYFEAQGDKFKISGNYYEEGTTMKISNLVSLKLTSNSSSGQFGVVTITSLHNTFNNTSGAFTVTILYKIVTSGHDKYGAYSTTTYHSKSFTLNPCNQTIS